MPGGKSDKSTKTSDKKPVAEKSTKASDKKPEKKTEKTEKTEKSSTKSGKSTSKSEKGTSSRRNLNEAVGFVYGGDLIKASCAYVFAVPNKEVKKYVEDNLVSYYGSRVSGRYIKCEDCQETFKNVLKFAEEKGYCTDAGSHILKIAVNNAANMLKEVSGENTAHTFTLQEKEDKKEKSDKDKSDKKGKSGKSEKKTGKKDKTEDESEASGDEEDDVEDEKDVSGDEDEDAEDAQDEDDTVSEEEEEEQKPVTKGSQKKGDTKSGKSADKGKNSNKAKEVKQKK